MTGSGFDIHEELRKSETEAWNALAHGKYSMFGYWAAWNVKLRRMAGQTGKPSPFRDLRALAHGRNVRVTLPDPEPFTQEEP